MLWSTRLASGLCDKPQLTKRFQESGELGPSAALGEGRGTQIHQKALGFPPNTWAEPHGLPHTDLPSDRTWDAGSRNWALVGCVCEARQQQQHWVHPIMLSHLALNTCFVLFKPNLIFLRYILLLQRRCRK